MRGDNSWNTGTYESTKMSSVQGLPTRGSDVTILITRVHLHPLCELVEFWAKFSQEGAADYLGLAKEIQSPANIFKESEGSPADQCLAQKDGFWHRARIVSRNGSQYIVFLIDKGMTYSTTSTMLAWGKKDHFYLPPEVEFSVLANVLPVSPENRWSPVALEFLKSLTGRSVKAHVQDVLMLHRMFVLNIPCISKQMYEMGFARKLSTEVFQDFLLASLESKSAPMQPPEPQSAISMGTGERLLKKEMFMYPELQAGTVETVVVTEVTNPQRIFCQLKVFSQELKKLSEQLTQCCDGRTATCTIGPEMIGFPCAAKGSDGKWYRSVLQQVFSANKVVEVLNVDYGTKQIVQVENVRPLASEFFRMPVVTYNCSLHGIIDKGVGWTTAQIDYLRTLLLFKTIIAKFEYQSITEGVYYVTLYGDENSNINNLFGSKESCLLQCEKTLGDYAIRGSGHGRSNSSVQFRRKGGVGENKKRGQVEDLPINSSHVAFVQYVSSPSKFWIQTENFAKELEKLMDKMSHLYQGDLKDDVVKTPTVGLYCGAKAEDGEYYRATITEVGEKRVKVFFVDYGNSETVNKQCIKTLPDEIKKMPQLALKCTLADVQPRNGEWSQEACELFTNAIMDKAITVHVAAKSDDGYVVRLKDPEAQGDLSKLLCSAGFAEKDETRRQSKVKMSSQMPVHSTTQSPGQFSGMPQPQITAVPVGNERKCATFKEQMFSIGSILDVNVSYIESPNDFWCQLVQSAGHLKLLMYDMQAHYRNSEFHPLLETACVARHPENGMWYRALIVHKHETPHVEVLFIDYGQTETVSIFDLRRLEKEFVTLPGQAFRCSLFNPVDPTSAINDWTEEAIDRFHTFVETAANNFVILKCTIYAVMYSEQKIVFNIVDLETPFESICTSLVNLVKSTPPVKPASPAFRLDTYYYSTHNVKTGTEEQVTVTSVKDVSHFYCQLQRNAHVLEELQIKVASLCEQLQKVKIPPVFGMLCFAKYTDGQWYRGQIKASKPSILVHFVDYGDTLEVDKSDLLPIPKEASDIMAVPVQAVVCGLSDVPDNLNSKANSWFETGSTECEFRALIVAREPDGKLMVELYQGKTQVNAKIKKMFPIEMCTEEPTCFPGVRSVEPSLKPFQKNTNVPKQAADLEDPKHTVPKSRSFVSKPPPVKNETISADVKVTPKPRQNVKDNRQKAKSVQLELYKPPHQRDLHVKPANEAQKHSDPPQCKDKDQNSHSHAKSSKPITNQHLPSPTTDGWTDGNDAPHPKVEKLPKLANLPPKSITSGKVTDVYVSHCNSPLSFYVQLVKEEDDIFSIVEKLNDPETSSKAEPIMEVQPGDLVQAEFTEDSSWYRAVVKERQDNTKLLVEFIDFGNTATVPLSKMSRLQESFLRLPAYSTHCMLSSATSLRKEQVLDKEVVSAFESAIGAGGEKQLKCKFLKLSGNVWEVGLEDGGMEVECKISVASQPDNTDVEQKPSEEKFSENVRFHYQDFQEGQHLEAYITSITDAQTFWCQLANTEELDQISQSVAEAGDAANKDLDSLSVGSPCIALFSEDQLWYRAEVLDIAREEMSLLFVDYGNSSQVKLSDVRPIPPELVQSPAQAFLCELEGFDFSEGSWEGNGADELSALTADQLLQMTVTKVTREEGKTKCTVRPECEGQVINDEMRKFWRSSVPVTGELPMSSETPPSCEPAVEEAGPLEPKEPESRDVSAADVLSKDQEDIEIEPCPEYQVDAYESVPHTVLDDQIPHIVSAPVSDDLPTSSEPAVEEPEEPKQLQSCEVSEDQDEPEPFADYQIPHIVSDDLLTSSVTPPLYEPTVEEAKELESCDVFGPEVLPDDQDAVDIEIEPDTEDQVVPSESSPHVIEDQAAPTESTSHDRNKLEDLTESLVEEGGNQILADVHHVCHDSEHSLIGPSEVAEDQMCSTFFDSQILESLEVSVITDITMEETVLYCSGDLSQSYKANVTDKGREEEDVSFLDLTEPEESGSPLDECFLEATDESGFTETPFESPSKGTDDSDTSNYFDPEQDAETPEVVTPEARPASKTSARMVPRVNICLKGNTSPDLDMSDNPTEESQPTEDQLLLSSCDGPKEELYEQEHESGATDGIMKDDATSVQVPCVSISLRLTSPDLDMSDEPMEESLQTEDLLLQPSNGVPKEELFDQERETGATDGALCSSMKDVSTNLEIPCLAFSLEGKPSLDLEMSDEPTEESEETEELPLQSSSDASPQDLFDLEHEDEAVVGDDSSLKDGAGKIDLVTELLSYRKETFSDLLGGGDTASIRPRMYTARTTAKGDGDGPEAMTSVSKETCLIDLCLEHKHNDNFPDASGDHRRTVAEEETDGRAPSGEVPCGQLIVLDDTETEPDSNTFTSFHFPQMSELTELLVQESCVSDICSGIFSEEPESAETVSSESLEDSLLTHTEESSDDTLTEESFVDDSFEAQLSKITHLSLIIEDGSVLERLSEE